VRAVRAALFGLSADLVVVVVQAGGCAVPEQRHGPHARGAARNIPHGGPPPPGLGVGPLPTGRQGGLGRVTTSGRRWGPRTRATSPKCTRTQSPRLAASLGGRCRATVKTKGEGA
jgi:hypothetical protein